MKRTLTALGVGSLLLGEGTMPTATDRSMRAA